MTTAATFSLKCETSVGDRVVLVGGLDVLGQWNPHASAAELSTDEHTYPVWTVSIEVPYDSNFEYKFTVVSSGGDVRWETIANRTLCIGAKPLEVQTAFDSGDTFGNRLQKALLDVTDAAPEEAFERDQLTPVTFRCNCDTMIGENVVVVGSHRQLGNWDPRASSVTLQTDGDNYPWWQATIGLLSGTIIEFKFVKVSFHGRFWESVDNRFVQVPIVPLELSALFDGPELESKEMSEMIKPGAHGLGGADDSTTEPMGVQEDEGILEREDSDAAADEHFEELVATLTRAASMPLAVPKSSTVKGVSQPGEANKNRARNSARCRRYTGGSEPPSDFEECESPRVVRATTESAVTDGYIRPKPLSWLFSKWM